MILLLFYDAYSLLYYFFFIRFASIYFMRYAIFCFLRLSPLFSPPHLPPYALHFREIMLLSITISMMSYFAIFIFMMRDVIADIDYASLIISFHIIMMLSFRLLFIISRLSPLTLFSPRLISSLLILF